MKHQYESGPSAWRRFWTIVGTWFFSLAVVCLAVTLTAGPIIIVLHFVFKYW